ncbi:hypothetical protein KEJ36_05470 [Candidatus Bathyarchaeota archaeon]|nr:hypothetical protein [Candidatus Bathyarchaeota archaeon]
MSEVDEALALAEVEAKSPVAMRRRDAWDKAFLAVIKAVDKLLVKYGYLEPERHGERFAYLRELESKVPEIGRAEFSEKLGARFGKAHMACFYESKVELAQEEAVKAQQLVEEIKKFLK